MGDEFLTLVDQAADRVEERDAIGGTELSLQIAKIAPDLWEVESPDRVEEKEAIGHFFCKMTGKTHPDEVRVPARLVSHYGQCIKIWLYARWLDKHPKFGNKGSGKITFSIFDAGMLLNRGESTIRKYLAQAARKGLIRKFFTNKEGQCTVFYASLEKAVQTTGNMELGPVASVPITRLESIAIIATEIEIAALQRSSFYAAIKAEKEEGNAPEMVNPIELLSPPCELPARVLGRSDRWIYTSEGFIPYGGSQKSVATVRDVTSRTVERHLSSRYRETPSPVKKYREELNPLLKGQIAQRISRSRSKEILASAQYFGEAGKYFKMGDRVFQRKCNIYADFDFHLVRCRFRRRRLKA